VFYIFETYETYPYSSRARSFSFLHRVFAAKCGAVLDYHG
jgi:hypothetical protein